LNAVCGSADATIDDGASMEGCHHSPARRRRHGGGEAAKPCKPPAVKGVTALPGEATTNTHNLTADTRDATANTHDATANTHKARADGNQATAQYPMMRHPRRVGRYD
jgi:hypothetical protein